MIPKRKAIEIYNKYYQLVADGAYPEKNARQCAFICVDEILEELGEELKHAYKYWQHVKQEIEKI